jgi:hypothetical protein
MRDCPACWKVHQREVYVKARGHRLKVRRRYWKTNKKSIKQTGSYVRKMAWSATSEGLVARSMYRILLNLMRRDEHLIAMGLDPEVVEAQEREAERLRKKAIRDEQPPEDPDAPWWKKRLSVEKGLKRIL